MNLLGHLNKALHTVLLWTQNLIFKTNINVFSPLSALQTHFWIAEDLKQLQYRQIISNILNKPNEKQKCFYVALTIYKYNAYM